MKMKTGFKTVLTLTLSFIMASVFVSCGGNGTTDPVTVPTSFTYAVGKNPSGIAIDSSGNVWVTNQGDGTVTELLYTPTPAGPSWAPNPSGPIKVGNGPTDIAIDATGNVWVTNSSDSTVTELNVSGSLIGICNVEIPAGTNKFDTNPTAIAIDVSGNVWVTLPGKEPLSIGGPPGSAVIKLTLVSGQLSISSFTAGFGPGAIAIDASGNVWVANVGGDDESIIQNCSVTKLSTLGTVLGTFTLGLNSSPVGIAIDISGNVWVTNPFLNTVTELSSSGALIGTYAVGNFPYGIAIDSAGNVWVTNAGSSAVPGTAIMELDGDGQILNTFAVGNNPVGIAIDATNNVWVSNYGSNSVTVWTGAASGPQFRPYNGPVWP